MMKNGRGIVFFTLLEVVVTMLIMAVVTALIIGAFHTGLMCYKKTSAYERPVMQAGAALALIQDDLRRFVPLNGDSVNFTADTMSFYAVSEEKGSHLEQVTYKVRNGRLEREASIYPEPDNFMKAGPSVVLDSVEKWIFSYQQGTVPRTLVADKKPAEKTEEMETAKSSGECWPVSVVIHGTLKGNYPADASILFPVFNISRKAEEKPSKDEKTQ